jgi:hypothetical protein
MVALALGVPERCGDADGAADLDELGTWEGLPDGVEGTTSLLLLGVAVMLLVLVPDRDGAVVRVGDSVLLLVLVGDFVRVDDSELVVEGCGDEEGGADADGEVDLDDDDVGLTVELGVANALATAHPITAAAALGAPNTKFVPP